MATAEWSMKMLKGVESNQQSDIDAQNQDVESHSVALRTSRDTP
jgi:hypothetical protein